MLFSCMPGTDHWLPSCRNSGEVHYRSCNQTGPARTHITCRIQRHPMKYWDKASLDNQYRGWRLALFTADSCRCTNRVTSPLRQLPRSELIINPLHPGCPFPLLLLHNHCSSASLKFFKLHDCVISLFYFPFHLKQHIHRVYARTCIRNGLLPTTSNLCNQMHSKLISSGLDQSNLGNNRTNRLYKLIRHFLAYHSWWFYIHGSMP